MSTTETTCPTCSKSTERSEEWSTGQCDDCFADDVEESTYQIYRHYQSEDFFAEIIQTGLTLEEAQTHCKDPETSSTTCTSAEGLTRTERCGPWFDGYEEER